MTAPQDPVASADISSSGVTVNDLYRVPKREVTAQVSLPGMPRTTLQIFLSERAETHTGYERPSDLLNGPNLFIPATGAGGVTIFLQRDMVISLAVPSEHEFGGSERAEDLAADEATHARVEVTLEDCSALTGVLAFLLPEGRRRLQDYLNGPEQFIVLRRPGQAVLINKRRIARVAPLAAAEARG